MRGRLLSLSGPRSALEKARPYLMTAMVPIVVLAAGSLVLEYGFRVSEATRRVLYWVEWIALAGMMLDSPVRLLLARERLALLRFRWLEFTVAVAFVLAVGFYDLAKLPAAEALSLRTVHIAIVINVLIRLAEVQRFLAARRIRPALLVIGSFATLVAIGTGLLLLPAVTEPGAAETTFMDALFTATSAVCVTGLTVVDIGKHFTPLGQYVVLGLIQLGGLGLMTFGSVFAVFMWRGLRLREAVVMREVVSHDLVAEIRRVIIFILISTVCIEAAGAALMLGAWNTAYTGAPAEWGDRIYHSLFHSVAAFCNAGFSLYTGNLTGLRHTWEVNVVIPLLIILGGLGFGVLYNVARLGVYRCIVGRAAAPLVKCRLTLQSKLAIVMTVGLLAGGTLLAYVFETFQNRPGVWQPTAYMAEDQGAPPAVSTSVAGGAATEERSPLGNTCYERLVNAWFLSTTARTAGFNSTDTARLSPPTKFLTVVLMFIGASPGSTGGGIKTVTFAVICLGIWSALRGRPHAQVFHRTIPWGTVTRALALMAVGALWVAAVSMIICAWGLLDGARFTFLDVLFETTSAFGTVGLSAGATPLLNTFGRLLIILTMFLGRVGPLSLLLAMQGRAGAAARYTYPTEMVATS
jgi:trk system potassium uptake protein TrkH